MYLFPYNLLGATDTKTLTVGETDTLTNIEGKALSLGVTDIQCDIIADVDINYLIPMNQNSTTASRNLVVA